MSNLALNPAASAARTPDRAAAITDESTMTYEELDTASARLATLLEREGISAGDRVTVQRLPMLTDDDVVLACLPLFHVFRMTCAMNANHRGGAGKKPMQATPKSAISLPIQSRRRT